ncbi:rhamnulokinase [Curtobacterium flaccumfaciens]|uniref:rhamnulokinase n=1 Tax=Curtobacterium flaccumfaciens TaxID=2035 RepID=UPI001BDEA3E5|nr:rhamnulokinase family protein [Curtobacterium flaccumfaciens]MBT1608195.1 rhamnulokinase [Curtobacterium flaccumfaciens pv. betae]MBT1657998.1 rhamnulokinase [Curtobacterium flaccumfaciens pv. betae]MCS0470221.1 rhamnulokinase [Curtobacterium flaccumfaciens pv. betae]MCS0474892.1 rhamnulokinase [Curtobacterium flaccumfaciens pv. betae]MCS0479598.1 rhamnulokinase [Curtobacterium flaccumfaciens pv. betae]
MHTSGSVAAVDLGATSGRVIVGHVDSDGVRMDHLARFPNGPVTLHEGDAGTGRDALHWDVVELYRQVTEGLRRAFAEHPAIASIGIDSWAVDYGLLRDGRLLGLPSHYRDDRHQGGVVPVHDRMAATELYARNGLQHLPFNTLFQWAGDPSLQLAQRALLVPDLLGYWLTGVEAAERTNASTTGVLNATTRGWDPAVRAAAGLPAGLLPTLRDPGDRLGPLLPSVAALVGGQADVTLVGSHDTASAVVAVPATEPDFAYISSGTWSLVGVELDAPVLSDAARRANCTNEGGVDGRVRFLKNVSGLWLLSESVRTWERGGDHVDLEALLVSAAAVTAPVPVFDPADESFTAPGDMPARIAAWCAAHGLSAPASRAEFVRSILESLATAYAETLRTIADVTGKAIRVVHVVGGGSQNRLLCQLTADRTGLPVVAGPVEATALGNVLVQARAVGLAGLGGASLEALRSIVARSVEPVRYTPSASSRADPDRSPVRSHA